MNDIRDTGKVMGADRVAGDGGAADRAGLFSPRPAAGASLGEIKRRVGS